MSKLQIKSTVTEDVDNIYYEVTAYNPSYTYLPAQVQDPRTIGILSHTEDWEVTVSNFNLPAGSVPLVRFVNASIPPNYTQGYWLSIIVNNDLPIPTPVIYAPSQATRLNTGSVPPAPYNNAIFDYTLFLSMINTAFVTLWGSTTPPLTSNPPFITYSPSTLLFSLNIDAAETYYNGKNWNTSIKIFFNQALHKYFKFPGQYQSVPTDPNNQIPLDYNLLFINMNNGPLDFFFNRGALVIYDFLQLPQEFSTLSKWIQYSKILFRTSTIPVKQRDMTDLSAIGTPQGFSLLTSYELSDGEIFDRSNISYNPTTTAKFISMLPQGVLNRIEIIVQLMGNDTSDIINVYLGALEKIGISLWFRRKNQKVIDYALIKTVEQIVPQVRKAINEFLNHQSNQHEQEVLNRPPSPKARLPLLPKK